MTLGGSGVSSFSYVLLRRTAVVFGAEEQHPPQRRGSGSRSAAAGRGLSSGRCYLPVLRAPPDGEAVSVPQSLFLPEVPS